jgi:hypothetical protein
VIIALWGLPQRHGQQLPRTIGSKNPQGFFSSLLSLKENSSLLKKRNEVSLMISPSKKKCAYDLLHRLLRLLHLLRVDPNTDIDLFLFWIREPLVVHLEIE